MTPEFIHRYFRIPYTLHVREHRKSSVGRPTILFLHGLGDTGKLWTPIISRLPSDYRIVTVDLLGFGDSPKPVWAKLNTKIQARAIAATILKLRVFGRVVVVGHSMGALVAVELARRHPRLVRGVILCSPPFYKPSTSRFRLISREEQLKRIYRSIMNHPDRFMRLVNLAMRYKFVSDTHEITEKNIDTYISALEASILSQASLDDAKRLRQPIRILHGVFDPVVIRANVREFLKTATNSKMKHVLAGHEIKGPYIHAVVNAVTDMADHRK